MSSDAPVGDAAPIRVAVPEMIVWRVSKTRTYLYYTVTDEGIPILVAETEEGYFGVSPLCPHENLPLRGNGIVDPVACSLFCKAHAVTFDLHTGEPTENYSAIGDLGQLKRYTVKREGDFFVIDNFL